MLSDRDLAIAMERGEVSITPFDERLVQPASVDLCLDRDFKIMRPHNLAYIDVAKDQNDYLYEDVQTEVLIIGPGQFVLASTVEVVGLGRSHFGRVEGKSSLGRLGLLVHSTAGFIDPGFAGNITLELGNISPLPIQLYLGMPICQLSVGRLDSPAIRVYDGKYQGQRGPKGSAYWKNFEQGGFMHRGEP